MADKRNEEQTKSQNIEHPEENEVNKVPKTSDPSKQPITGTNATHQGDDTDTGDTQAPAGTTDGDASGGGGARMARNGRKDVDTYFDSDNKKENDSASEAVKDQSGDNNNANGQSNGGNNSNN